MNEDIKEEIKEENFDFEENESDFIAFITEKSDQELLTFYTANLPRNTDTKHATLYTLAAIKTGAQIDLEANNLLVSRGFGNPLKCSESLDLGPAFLRLVQNLNFKDLKENLAKKNAKIPLFIANFLENSSAKNIEIIDFSALEIRYFLALAEFLGEDRPKNSYYFDYFDKIGLNSQLARIPEFYFSVENSQFNDLNEALSSYFARKIFSVEEILKISRFFRGIQLEIAPKIIEIMKERSSNSTLLPYFDCFAGEIQSEEMIDYLQEMVLLQPSLFIDPLLAASKLKNYLLVEAGLIARLANFINILPEFVQSFPNLATNLLENRFTRPFLATLVKLVLMDYSSSSKTAAAIANDLALLCTFLDSCRTSSALKHHLSEEFSEFFVQKLERKKLFEFILALQRIDLASEALNSLSKYLDEAAINDAERIFANINNISPIRSTASLLINVRADHPYLKIAQQGIIKYLNSLGAPENVFPVVFELLSSLYSPSISSFSQRLATNMPELYELCRVTVANLSSAIPSLSYASFNFIYDKIQLLNDDTSFQIGTVHLDQSIEQVYRRVHGVLQALTVFADYSPSKEAKAQYFRLLKGPSEAVSKMQLASITGNEEIFLIADLARDIEALIIASSVAKYAYTKTLASYSSSALSIDDFRDIFSKTRELDYNLCHPENNATPLAEICECYETITIQRWNLSAVPQEIMPFLALRNIFGLAESCRLLDISHFECYRNTVTLALSSSSWPSIQELSGKIRESFPMNQLNNYPDVVEKLIYANANTAMPGFWNFIYDLPRDQFELDSKFVDLFDFVSLSPADADTIKAIRSDLLNAKMTGPLDSLADFNIAFNRLLDSQVFDSVTRLAYQSDTFSSEGRSSSDSLINVIRNLISDYTTIRFFSTSKLNASYSFTWGSSSETDIAGFLSGDLSNLENTELINIIDAFKKRVGYIKTIKNLILTLATYNQSDSELEILSNDETLVNTIQSLDDRLSAVRCKIQAHIDNKDYCSRFSLSSMLALENIVEEPDIMTPSVASLTLDTPQRNFVLSAASQPWRLLPNIILSFASTQQYAPKPYQFLSCAPYLFSSDIDHVLEQAHSNKYTLAIMFPELLNAEVFSYLMQKLSDSSFTASYSSFVYIFTTDDKTALPSTVCHDPLSTYLLDAKESQLAQVRAYLKDYISTIFHNGSTSNESRIKLFYSKKPGEGKTTKALKWLRSLGLDESDELTVMDEQYACDISSQLVNSCGLLRFSPDSTHATLHASYLLPLLFTGGLYTNACELPTKKLVFALECASVFDSSLYDVLSLMPSEAAVFNIKELDIHQTSTHRAPAKFNDLLVLLQDSIKNPPGAIPPTELNDHPYRDVRLANLHQFKEYSLTMLAAVFLASGDNFNKVDILNQDQAFIEALKGQEASMNNFDTRNSVISLFERYYLNGTYNDSVNSILIMSPRRYLRIFENNYQPTDAELESVAARLESDKTSTIERLSSYSAIHDWSAIVLQQILNALLNVSQNNLRTMYFDKIAMFMNWARYLVRTSVAAIKQSNSSLDLAHSRPVDLFENDFAEINCPNSYVHLAPFLYGSEDKKPNVFIPCIQDSNFCSRDSSSNCFGLNYLQKFMHKVSASESTWKNLDELDDPLFRYLIKLFLGCPYDNLQDLPEYEAIKNFSLTPENTVKIINILLKLMSRQPVLLIGETGIGKTAIVSFVANVLGSTCVTLNCTANTTKAEIDTAIAIAVENSNNVIDRTLVSRRQAITMAKRFPKSPVNAVRANILNDNIPKVILFFDEMNTCSCMDYFEQIFQGISHPILANNPNIVVIGSANPWRFTADSKSLTYLVNPLSYSSLGKAWDFGALKFEHEAQICKAIIEKAIANPEEAQSFYNLVSASHRYVKNTLSATSVSLRDFHRSVNVYQTVKTLISKIGATPDLSLLQIVSIWVSYILKNPDTSTYPSALCSILEKDDVSSIINEIYALYRSVFETCVPLNDRTNVAPNIAITENFFTVMISMLSTDPLPLLLVGPPGSSKTHTTSLLQSVFRGKLSHLPYFTTYQPLQTLNFQGSLATTSAEIDMLFNQARNSRESYLDQESSVLSNILIVFDELGLADKSPANPLKTLHYQLCPTAVDSTGRKTGMDGFNFIGLSNDPLDAAKLNRCLYVNRGPMTVTQLKDTAHYLRTDLEQSSIDPLVEAYHHVHVASQDATLLPSGLRDFYSILKSVPPNFDLRQLYVSAIRSLGHQAQRFFAQYCHLQNIHPVPFINDTINPLELFKSNLQESNSRHILAVSYPGLAYSMACKACDELNRPSPIYRVVNRMKEDELFTFVKKAMENGDVICLSGPTPYLSALYTVLNRSITMKEGKAYSLLVSSSLSGRLHPLHPDFKIILELTPSEVAKQDPALLNRLERYNCVQAYSTPVYGEGYIHSVFNKESTPYFFATFGDRANSFLSCLPHVVDKASQALDGGRTKDYSLAANLSRLTSALCFVFCPASKTSTMNFLNNYNIDAIVLGTHEYSYLPEVFADLRSGELTKSVIFCYDVSFRASLEYICPQTTDTIQYFSVSSLDGNFEDINTMRLSRYFRYNILINALSSCIAYASHSIELRACVRNTIEHYRTLDHEFIDHLLPPEVINVSNKSRLQTISGYYDLVSLVSAVVSSYHVLLNVAKRVLPVLATELFRFPNSQAIEMLARYNFETSPLLISYKEKIVISSFWCNLLDYVNKSNSEAIYHIPYIAILATIPDNIAFGNFDDMTKLIYSGHLEEVLSHEIVSNIPNRFLFDALVTYKSDFPANPNTDSAIFVESPFTTIYYAISPLTPIFLLFTSFNAPIDLRSGSALSQSITAFFAQYQNIDNDLLAAALSVPLEYLPVEARIGIFTAKIQHDLSLLPGRIVLSPYDLMEQLDLQSRAVFLNHFIRTLIETEQVHPSEAFSLLQYIFIGHTDHIDARNEYLTLLGQSIAKLARIIVEYAMPDEGYSQILSAFISTALLLARPLENTHVPLISAYAEALYAINPKMVKAPLNAGSSQHIHLLHDASHFDITAKCEESSKFIPNCQLRSLTAEKLLNHFIRTPDVPANDPEIAFLVDFINSSSNVEDERHALILAIVVAIDFVESDTDSHNFFTRVVKDCDSYFSQKQSTEIRYQHKSQIGVNTVYPHAFSALPDDVAHSFTRAVKCPCGDMLWFLDACGNFNENKTVRCPYCQRLIAKPGHAANWQENNEAIPITEAEVNRMLSETWRISDEFYNRTANIREVSDDALHVARIFSNSFALLSLITTPEPTCEFFAGVTIHDVASSIIRHYNTLKDFKTDSSVLTLLSVALPLLAERPMDRTHLNISYRKTYESEIMNRLANINSREEYIQRNLRLNTFEDYVKNNVSPPMTTVRFTGSDGRAIAPLSVYIALDWARGEADIKPRDLIRSAIKGFPVWSESIGDSVKLNTFELLQNLCALAASARFLMPYLSQYSNLRFHDDNTMLSGTDSDDATRSWRLPADITAALKTSHAFVSSLTAANIYYECVQLESCEFTPLLFLVSETDTTLYRLISVLCDTINKRFQVRNDKPANVLDFSFTYELPNLSRLFLSLFDRAREFGNSRDIKLDAFITPILQQLRKPPMLTVSPIIIYRSSSSSDEKLELATQDATIEAYDTIKQDHKLIDALDVVGELISQLPMDIDWVLNLLAMKLSSYDQALELIDVSDDLAALEAFENLGAALPNTTYRDLLKIYNSHSVNN